MIRGVGLTVACVVACGARRRSQWQASEHALKSRGDQDRGTISRARPALGWVPERLGALPRRGVEVNMARRRGQLLRHTPHAARTPSLAVRGRRSTVDTHFVHPLLTW